MKQEPDGMQASPPEPSPDPGESALGQSPAAATGDDRPKAEEYLKQLQRVQADFVNYRRRVEQEKVEQAKYATVSILQKVLPALDDMDRAIKNVPTALAKEPWVEGVTLIERKLRQAMEAEGVERIPDIGAEFDPNVHEAVMHQPGDPETENKVTAVFQTGYKLHDRVIRPAMVKVGGTPEGPRPPTRQTERLERDA